MLKQEVRIRIAIRYQFVVLPALLAGAAIAHGANQPCPGTTVIVQSGEPRNVADVCRAATMATDLLSRCGIVRNTTLRISLIDKVRHPCGAAVLGQYLSKEDRIELTTYKGCLATLQPDNVYRKLPQREVWRSLAVHEIAHGIVSSVVRGKNLASVAHEYVAYVIQISSLSAGSRRKLLEAMPGAVPPNTTSFTELYHAIYPLRFGVNAYRHYSAMRDGCVFLNQVLGGEIRFPREEGRYSTRRRIAMGSSGQAGMPGDVAIR